MKKTVKKHEQKLWHWGPDQEKAIETLKELLMSAPILGYAISNLSYELHTDPS